MDKTLLRPLFQKRFMELHKPKGFFVGGVAMQADQARERQSGVMSLAQDNIVTNPNSGVQQKIDVKPDTPTEDVDINESIVIGRENEKALNKDQRFVQELDQGIMKIQQESQQRPQQDANTNFIDQRVNQQRLQNDQERIQTLEEEKKKVKSEGLFSRSDQLGMFAALVARRLAEPGATLSSGFSYGVGDFANLYGKTKAAEAELLASKSKKGKNMWVFDSRADNGKGKNIFIPEDTYDPRYHTKAKTEEKGILDVVQFDNDGVANIMSIATADFNPKVHEKFLGRTSAMLANDPNQTVIEITANEFFRDNYFAEKVPGYKRKYVKPPSTRESALADRQKQKEFEKRLEDKLKLEEKLNKSLGLANLGDIALGYVLEGGRTGAAATFSEYAAGLGGFIRSQFTRQSLGIGESKANSEVESMRQKLETDYGDTNIFEEDVNLTILSKRFRALDAGLRSIVIELAYAKAKQREEGGRFSVSDIENAMASIGNTSDEISLRQKLAQTLFNDLDAPIQEYERKYGTLPKEYRELYEKRDLFEKARPVTVLPASEQIKRGVPKQQQNNRILKPGESPTQGQPKPTPPGGQPF